MASARLSAQGDHCALASELVMLWPLERTARSGDSRRRDAQFVGLPAFRADPDSGAHTPALGLVLNHRRRHIRRCIWRRRD